MSAPEVDHAQALLIPQQDDVVDCRNEMQETQGDTRLIGIWQAIHNFKHLKSLHILKSALTIFTTSTKLMSLMIFSIIPLYLFMVFYEIQLLQAIVAAPNALNDHYRITRISTLYASNYGSHSHARVSTIYDHYGEKVVFLTHVLLLCLLYFVIYLLLEFLSMTITIQIAAKVYANEKPATLKDVFYRRNNLKGVLTTCGYVHLLSCLTLLGLIWVVMNSLLLTGTSVYWLLDRESFWNKFSIGIHTILFVALLYKYSEWSAFWNLAMVISVLEEETGLDAFGMATYYGKQFKPTRVQLMVGSVGFGILLRLPCLFVGSSNWIIPGVVIGLVCLGYLVKWVAFVLYYFDCKQQTLEKKNDEEIAKPVNIG